MVAIHKKELLPINSISRNNLLNQVHKTIREKNMKSYWYVSLTHKYPQPNRSTDSVRVVMSVQIKRMHLLLK